MPRFNERTAILDDGVFLPKFLFHFNNSKSKSTSPAAGLNPASALDGQGFESSTSPSAMPQKRTLISDVTKAAILIKMADDEGALSEELLKGIRKNLTNISDKSQLMPLKKLMNSNPLK